MKKIVFIILAFYASFFVHSQTNDKKHIEVRGEAVYEKVVENYTTEIILAQELCYNYNNENISLEELKNTFLKKLAKNGINKNNLIENELDFLLLSYRKKGTFYKFTTKNKDEFLKLISIKSNGLEFRNKKITYKSISASEAKKLRKRALEDAQKKADNYASIINKKTTEVTYIRDYNYTQELTSTIYYPKNKNVYKITVGFSF